ncbi:uncharacterized protein KD926_006277 [Aspergillus affinis]|uniref:uncharacterized protein n=1 Tax=Aspergillus affinis TaxID=1070780 RepID=UPI0022FDBB6F|nr:uncharacterized protein KD926_006277 [Aspergillus affinis]KAI9041940.1 hypothetical protein KD926_006277 [Aspergillus affinis]
MDSCPQEIVSKVDCSSTLTGCGKTLRAQFAPTQQRLELTLEQSRSLATVIEGDKSLARHFGVPLASDSMTGKIDPLFGKLQLIRDDEGKVDNTICWLDIVLAPSYKPARREDGYYYLQLDGRSGLIQVSESDHNFIESGLPQKLINPRSYPSDVQSEEETMRLVEGLLLNLNQLASQIIDLNNECREKISQRLEILRQFSGGYSQNTQRVHDKSNHVDLQTTEPPEPATPKGIRKRKLPSTWEPEELDRLPRWFGDHKHLTKKQVEAEFKKDFGRFRTFGAIMAAHYRARNEHGTHRVGLKRKLHPDDSLPPSTAIESARVAVPDRIYPSLPTSDSCSRPSVSFLPPLRSLCSPGTSNGGTTEKQCTESPHRTTHIETVTPRETAERPLWKDCSFSSTSRAEVEDFAPTGTAILNPEQTTRDGRSSRRGHQSIQPCPIDTREGNNTLRHDSPIDSLEHVEGDTAVDHHGLSGQQHSVSASNEGSPGMPSDGSWVNPDSPSFVSGQDTLDGRGGLTAANRLPLPIYPDTGPQVMPPIDQVLNGQLCL